MSQKKKVIAVYAIAKNESKFAERWYNCVKEADYVCVLDTGSTDDTAEKFRRLGAIVEEKKYDTFMFDRARNDSMSIVPADADILFCLDIDETISPGWRKMLEPAWIQAEDKGIHPVCAEYELKTWFNDKGECMEIAQKHQIHTRESKWVYGCHEGLRHPNGGKVVLPKEFVLEHHPDPNKSRAQYLPMLEASVKEMPDSARLRLFYGRELANRQNFPAAKAELKKCVELSALPNQDIDDLFRAEAMYYLAKVCWISHEKAAAEMWALRSVAQFPKKDNLYYLGYIYENNGDHRLACRVLEQCINTTTHINTYPEEHEAWTGQPYGWYARALFAMGNPDKAREMAALGLQKEPDNNGFVDLIKEIDAKTKAN